MCIAEQLNTHDKEILQERAKRLALPLAELGGEYLQVLSFVSGNHRYAIERSYISEVTPLDQMTPLPGVPPFVLGIVNRHGRIMAILDLQSILGMPSTPVAQKSTAIFLRGAMREFGLLAEEMIGFISIPAASLQSPLPSANGSGSTFVSGVTIDGLALLAAEKLLLDKSLVVDQCVGVGP